MRYADIPGHEDVKRRLTAMVEQNRIPHALLLEGPAGAGKFALACATTQYIHCTNRSNGDSCGRCPACQQHQTFNHIDTVYTFPVVKKGNVGLADDYIEEFKSQLSESPFMDFELWLQKLDNINAQPQIYVEEANTLIRKLSFTAHGSQYKVVLMWLPERMRDDTANKLLKLVEEPYEDTIFIMASDNPRGILPTIYSRTQRISVSRYDDEQVAQYLISTQGIDPEAAALTARLSSGSITEALKQINVSKERSRYLELFIELMRKAYTRRVGELKAWAADVASLGRERELHFWDYCARMIRENFILNLKEPRLNYLTTDEMNFSRNFSPFINERNVLPLYDVINDARADIAANANAKLVNFDVAIKVILLLKS